MNAPPPPSDYQAPASTVLVPMVLWDQIRAALPAVGALSAEADRLHDEAQRFETPEQETVAYQILTVLAKSDGNLTTHMDEHTMVVMYGEMVRNLLATFTITRKDQETR